MLSIFSTLGSNSTGMVKAEGLEDSSSVVTEVVAWRELTEVREELRPVGCDVGELEEPICLQEKMICEIQKGREDEVGRKESQFPGLGHHTAAEADLPCQHSPGGWLRGRQELLEHPEWLKQHCCEMWNGILPSDSSRASLGIALLG